MLINFGVCRPHVQVQYGNQSGIKKEAGRIPIWPTGSSTAQSEGMQNSAMNQVAITQQATAVAQEMCCGPKDVRAGFAR